MRFLRRRSPFIPLFARHADGEYLLCSQTSGLVRQTTNRVPQSLAAALFSEFVSKKKENGHF